MALGGRHQPARRLLGGRARHADRDPALHLHGDHAAAIEDRRRPADDDGAALRARSGRARDLGRGRRRAARGNDGDRRRHGGGDGPHLAAGDAAQFLFRPARDRHHRGLGDARADHPAVGRPHHPCRPARLGGRSGGDAARGPLQGSDRRGVAALGLRRHLDERGRDVRRRLHPGPRARRALCPLHPNRRDRAAEHGPARAPRGAL